MGLGIAQYARLTGGIFTNLTTTLQSVPGMSFEMGPGKSYLVRVVMNMTIKNPEGYNLRWTNVANTINPDCLFSFLPSIPFNGNVIIPAVGIAVAGSFNDNGRAEWAGIFTNNSTSLKQTAQLQAAQQQAGGGLGVQISVATIIAVLIN